MSVVISIILAVATWSPHLSVLSVATWQLFLATVTIGDTSKYVFRHHRSLQCSRGPREQNGSGLKSDHHFIGCLATPTSHWKIFQCPQVQQRTSFIPFHRNFKWGCTWTTARGATAIATSQRLPQFQLFPFTPQMGGPTHCPVMHNTHFPLMHVTVTHTSHGTTSLNKPRYITQQAHGPHHSTGWRHHITQQAQEISEPNRRTRHQALTNHRFFFFPLQWMGWTCGCLYIEAATGKSHSQVIVPYKW